MLRYGAPFGEAQGRPGHEERFVTSSGPIARLALALTDWTERWIPDAFIFALLATLIVVGAGAASRRRRTLAQTVDAWGRGFWELIPFTLQMSLVIITGHVLATSPPMGRVIRAIAVVAATPRGAVALVTFFALASSWFNWGFSLVFSAVLASEVARRVEGVDYRALAAASVLGLGSIWAQGLSGSAALQMATPGALQPQIRDIVVARRPGARRHHRLPPHDLPVAEPRRRSLVEIVVVTAVMWLATPPAGRGRTARDLGIDLGPTEVEIADPESAANRSRPAQWLEHSPLLTWLIVALGVRLSRALLRGGRRAAERAEPQHPQPGVPARSDSCCTARRRG